MDILYGKENEQIVATLNMDISHKNIILQWGKLYMKEYFLYDSLSVK